MANTAHLFRRQSSRDLNFHGSHRDYTKTLDELELKVDFMHEFFSKSKFQLVSNRTKIANDISHPHNQRLKEKLVRADSLDRRGPLYGATNQAFNSDDVLTGRHFKQPSKLLEIFEEPDKFHSTVSIPAATAAEQQQQQPTVPPKDEELVADDAREGDERESWDSKITFLLATIG